MISEKFTTKFFTETISLQGVREGGINIDLFKTAFFELASRQLPISSENARHKISLEVISLLVNTPRRFHRFKYALGRRLPNLLDEVDEYDLLIIAALEACDATVLTMLINDGNEIFVKNRVNEELKNKIEHLDGAEKTAYTILVQRDNGDTIDRYTRAAAKEHWRAAFLGLGTYTSIMKWVDILSKEDEDAVIVKIKDLLTEITATKDNNYEMITDALRDLFQKKYDVEKNISVICKILQEIGRSKLGPLVTPILARIIQEKLSVKDAELRFNLLKVYMSLDDVDYSFPGRLFFYLVEDQERGKASPKLSEHQVGDLANILLADFIKKQHDLDLSENCISYIYRAKWASQYLEKKDPTFTAVMSKLKDPVMMDTFVSTLLSLRHPWKPIFSDNHVEMIQKLIGVENFSEAVVGIDHSKLNQVTITALDDFKGKFAKANGDINALVSMFD